MSCLLVRVIPSILNAAIRRHEIPRCGTPSNNFASLCRALRDYYQTRRTPRSSSVSTVFESSRDNKTRGKTQKSVSLGADKQKRPFRLVILKPFVGLAMLLGHLSPDVPARKDSPSDWS